MNALRPVVNRVVSRAATNQPCRRCYASIDQVIYKGIRRDSREESRSFERPRGSRDARNSRSSYDSSSYDHSNRRYEPKQEYTREPRRAIQKVDQASEWIYGTSVVEAALKSKRRTLHRLYVYAGENRTEANKDRDIKFKNMARGLKIDVREVTDAGMLDSMSNSRPHNGYVLEASPLVKTPILSLGGVSFDKRTFDLQIAQHDITNSGVILNDLPKTLQNRDPSRYPLILMLDEILDPGNLGAILRTAYYLGCSALLVSERNCAPLSPTCLKTSAGASEYMPVLSQVTPTRLIASSQAAGWKFFAAIPLPTKNQSRRDRYLTLDREEVQDALKTGPTVIVMGGEGEGIRESVKKVCDWYVSIGCASDVDRGVDSLNVSVAAGVLCQAFLGSGKPYVSGTA